MILWSAAPGSLGGLLLLSALTTAVPSNLHSTGSTPSLDSDTQIKPRTLPNSNILTLNEVPYTDTDFTAFVSRAIQKARTHVWQSGDELLHDAYPIEITAGVSEGTPMVTNPGLLNEFHVDLFSPGQRATVVVEGTYNYSTRTATLRAGFWTRGGLTWALRLHGSDRDSVATNRSNILRSQRCEDGARRDGWLQRNYARFEGSIRIS